MRPALLLLLSAAALWAQPAQPPEPAKETDEGFPVNNAAVKQACSPCHKADEKNRLTRISFRRTTPEGWQQTIKRMVSLDGVQLTPDAARQILHYLANEHGLAPEEARPGAFEVDKRIIDYKYTADTDTEQTCIKCHSFGRVLLQRRSKMEWEGLMAMHRGYYPLIDFQSFRRMGPPATTPNADNRHPMDKAVAHLSTVFPLHTAEWSAWNANRRPARLEGRWAITGYQTGKGAVYGEVNIRPTAVEDEFLTSTTLVYARSGQSVARAGKSILYTGFQWRGRSMVNGDEKTSVREVMFLERNQRELNGRWFWGEYDETGIDLKLTRITADPLLSGLDRPAMRKGANGVVVQINGVNLPANLTAKDVDFGPGITVRSVQSQPARLTATLDVAADARPGPRDLRIGPAVKENASVVYDKIDAIKVRPQSGLSRLGGARFPKQLQQFEAIGFSNGPDGKPDTKDDLELGIVDVAWSMEEYTATFGDDDKEYVGSLDAAGLFTPNVDGPNSSRKGNRNNVGDVWIVATHPAAGSAKPLRARAHLLVTVPVYMRFDQPEVAR